MHRSVCMRSGGFSLKTHDKDFVAPWSIQQEREAVWGCLSGVFCGDGHAGIVLEYCIGLVSSCPSSRTKLRCFHREMGLKTHTGLQWRGTLLQEVNPRSELSLKQQSYQGPRVNWWTKLFGSADIPFKSQKCAEGVYSLFTCGFFTTDQAKLAHIQKSSQAVIF